MNENQLTAEQIAVIAASAASSALAERTASGNEAVIKLNEKVHNKQVQQQNYANKIASEMRSDDNCSIITIPEIFRRYQPNFTASVNGCTITIPANGKPYKVHNDFAIIILKRMQRLSANIDRMSNPEITEYRR